MERALERMEKVKRPVLTQKQMQLQFDEAGRSGQEVVVMENLSKSFSEKQSYKKSPCKLGKENELLLSVKTAPGNPLCLK